MASVNRRTGAQLLGWQWRRGTEACPAPARRSAPSVSSPREGDCPSEAEDRRRREATMGHRDAAGPAPGRPEPNANLAKIETAPIEHVACAGARANASLTFRES